MGLCLTLFCLPIFCAIAYNPIALSDLIEVELNNWRESQMFSIGNLMNTSGFVINKILYANQDCLQVHSI